MCRFLIGHTRQNYKYLQVHTLMTLRQTEVNIPASNSGSSQALFFSLLHFSRIMSWARASARGTKNPRVPTNQKLKSTRVVYIGLYHSGTISTFVDTAGFFNNGKIKLKSWTFLWDWPVSTIAIYVPVSKSEPFRTRSEW